MRTRVYWCDVYGRVVPHRLERRNCRAKSEAWEFTRDRQRHARAFSIAHMPRTHWRERSSGTREPGARDPTSPKANRLGSVGYPPACHHKMTKPSTVAFLRGSMVGYSTRIWDCPHVAPLTFNTLSLFIHSVHSVHWYVLKRTCGQPWRTRALRILNLFSRMCTFILTFGERIFM